jgi:hypothetical protein
MRRSKPQKETPSGLHIDGRKETRSGIQKEVQKSEG